MARFVSTHILRARIELCPMVELAAREAGNVPWKRPGGKGNRVWRMYRFCHNSSLLLQAGKGTRPTVHGKQVAGPRQVLGVLSSWRVGTQEPDYRLWRLAAGEEAVTPPEHTLQTWSLSDT